MFIPGLLNGSVVMPPGRFGRVGSRPTPCWLVAVFRGTLLLFGMKPEQIILYKRLICESYALLALIIFVPIYASMNRSVDVRCTCFLCLSLNWL